MLRVCPIPKQCRVISTAVDISLIRTSEKNGSGEFIREDSLVNKVIGSEQAAVEWVDSGLLIIDL